MILIFKKQLVGMALVLLSCFLAGAMSPGFCQSAFDSDEDTLEVFEDNGKEKTILDEDSMEDENLQIFEDDGTVTQKQLPLEKSSLAHRFLDDSTFTLGYQFSLATGTNAEIVTNYAYLRHEYETLFCKNLFFKFDGKVKFIPETDHRADAEDKDLFLEGSVRELYLQAGYDDFSVKLGNQIIVWGKADTAAITDVVSPRDLSEFIFLELEDARFGQFMLSSDIYWDIANLFVFISPFPDTDREPDIGTRYFRTLPDLDSYAINENKPEFGDLEYGLRLSKTLEKTELSFMAGRFFANAPVYGHNGAFENDMPILRKDFAEYNMAGAAVSYAMQSFLLKFEGAFKNNFPLQGLDENNYYTIVASDIFDAMAGLEYNANDRYLLTFELSNRHIFGNMSTLPATDRDSTSFYFAYLKNFFNDTLEFEYIFYYHIQDENLFHDFQLTYDVTDNIEVKGSLALFNMQDKDSILWQYKDEDRITFEIRYYF
ncbi:MAG: hypothetical protein GY729_21365 [Desulfobacteraceae bacterium]|nr:hypothetical protein [Desulfobacteraceae bacterium]